jgi:hypothetical protein
MPEGGNLSKCCSQAVKNVEPRLIQMQGNDAREYPSLMDKKEINSPKLTEHFLFWVCGIGGLLLAFLFAHYVYHIL